jgi:hypothetical protein
MWSSKKENSLCSAVRDALENTAQAAPSDATPLGADAQSDSPSLSPELQDHLASCSDCQAASDERSMSRFLFSGVARTSAPDAWFASRVMAAIAAREFELRQSLETWAVLPRLAARLTWVSALALLLMGTWVFESPKFARNSDRAPASQSGASQSGSESLFESPQSQVSDDSAILDRSL